VCQYINCVWTLTSFKEYGRDEHERCEHVVEKVKVVTFLKYCRKVGYLEDKERNRVYKPEDPDVLVLLFQNLFQSFLAHSFLHVVLAHP